MIHPPNHLKVVSRKEGTTTALAVEHMQKGSINWITAPVKTNKTYNAGQKCWDT